MPNNIQLKIALIGIVALAGAILALSVFDVNLPARANPESRALDSLLVDMGVEIFPSSSSQVEVRLPDLNGAEVNIADFKGKIVFLNFWATWCPTCVIEMPAMEKLYRRLKNKDFAMVSVNLQDSAAQVKRFFEQNQLTFTALLDSLGKSVPDFAIREIPTTLIIDKSGRLVGRVVGQRQWDSRESIAMFERLIAEPIAVSTESHSLQQRRTSKKPRRIWKSQASKYKFQTPLSAIGLEFTLTSRCLPHEHP